MGRALPLFEQRMLGRCARSVLQSREKAREMHSATALQQGRKVQRETSSGIDMQQVIQKLRDQKIGAASGAGKRGLDGVIADSIRNSGLLGPPEAKRSDKKQTDKKLKTKRELDALAEIADLCGLP